MKEKTPKGKKDKAENKIEFISQNEIENTENKEKEKSPKNEGEKQEKKTAKKEKVEKIKKEEINIENMTFDIIIEPESLLKKENLENSDFILLIIEVAQNGLKYGIKKSNKSRLFWVDVFKNENFSILFKQFKPETLRKYWKIIRDSEKVKSFVQLVNRFYEKINRNNIK